MFGDEIIAQRILGETDPREIKRLSKKIQNVNEEEWNKSIQKLVTPILIDKFEQNEHLLNWLRSTGTRKPEAVFAQSEDGCS